MARTPKSRRARFASVTNQSDHGPDPKADFPRYPPNADALRAQLQRSFHLGPVALLHNRHIAAKLDAEEWRDLVGAYIHAASAVVVEIGGKVAKKLGDGMMALFGSRGALLGR